MLTQAKLCPDSWLMSLCNKIIKYYFGLWIFAIIIYRLGRIIYGNANYDHFIKFFPKYLIMIFDDFIEIDELW